MTPRRGSRRRDTTRPQPVEMIVETIVEVDESGRRIVADRPARRTDPVVALAAVAALVVTVAVGWLVGRGEDADRDEAIPTTSVPTDSRPSTSSGDLTVVASSIDGDRVRLSATSTAASGAPWVAFEMCAADPPGCTPLWTIELDQNGSTYTAELRVPDSFRSPGGYEHDCATGVGCELRVTTAERSVVFPLVDGQPFAGQPVPTTAPTPTTLAAPTPGLMVTTEPTTLLDREPTRVEVAGASPNDSYAIVVCAAEIAAADCPVVHRGTTDADGRASVVLRLPQIVSGWEVTESGSEWRETDCAVASCRLRVDGSTGSAAVDVSFEALIPSRPGPEVALDPRGPFAIGDIVAIEGSGVVAVSPTTVARARWIICDNGLESLDQVPGSCGTPRTIRAPSVDSEGSFSVSVLVPDPSLVRTWDGGRPLECSLDCRIVVLIEPFPALVIAPIDIRPTLGE